MTRRFPKFFTDLYRDLKDRRLLLPVAALAVAIVAVPMLIGGGSESSAPPPSAVPLDSDSAAVEPAVLTSDPGVREYRKRLATLKESNPFVQKFALPDPEQVALQSVDGASDSSGGAIGASSSTVSDTLTETSSSSSSSSSSSAGSPVTTDAPDTEADASDSRAPATTDAEAPEPEAQFYAGRIDVTVGELGDAKRIDGVRYLELLPSKSSPVVAFLGLAEGDESAAFSVSRDVVETDGDGSCAPKETAPCQFLTMHVGDQQTFKYADGRTFRLALRDTEIVRVPDPREQQGSDQAASGED